MKAGDRGGAGAGRLRKTWSTYVPYALGIGGNAGLNIVLLSLLTRRLEPSLYGGYTVAITAIVLASSVAGQWLQQATGRYLAGASRRAASYAKAAVLRGAGAILAVLAALYVLARVAEWFDGRAGALWSICVIAIAAQTLFTLVGTALQSEQRAWPYAIQQACASALKIAFSLLVCRLWQNDVGALLLAVAAAQCLGAAFGMLRAGLFASDVRDKLLSRRTRMVFHKLRIYGGAMTLWFIFMNLAMYCDRLLVRALAGPEMAGLYGAASTLVVGSVNLVMAPILAAAWPQLMGAWNARNEQAAARQLGDLLTWLLCAGAVLVALVDAVAVPATRLFLGDKFGAAATLLPLLLASSFCFSLGPFFHKPLEFKERKAVMCTIAALALLLNGVLSFVLTPRFGGVGAGCAALAAGASYCAVSGLIGRSIVPWRIRFDWLAAVAVLAMLAAWATHQVAGVWRDAGKFWALVAASGVFAVLFAIAVAAVWAMSRARRRFYGGALKSR
ncbi:lipopolysaccharide biosynthesis protein [Paraburkholderia kururiensis]|uniref:Lipopolysaccharide biosynthesis protein n=1 Tax=Paraburkholderia kururiensis TaxID=984307 RepID=A0ABZ0WHC9_9BURK|nr:lipopolysaccharide biosynthesis protein [Paraburkholderia kururiensis]WQD76743.1 lipopolysaccharide biosynthesis protein [Paraburkholderia kururiensis]